MDRPDHYILTDEQQAVLLSDAEVITVRAGAGTGKTRLLVEWYLYQILERGAHPSEIVAITFTRKAAAEMRERIVRRLRHAGKDEEARVAQVGPISTVHSLCERLLREHPLEAGVDPKFQIIGEGEDRLTQSVYRAISDPNLGEEEFAAVRTFVAKRYREADLDSPATWLARQIREFLQRWRQAGYGFERLCHVTEDFERFRQAQDECVQQIVEEALGEELGCPWWEDIEATKRAFRAKRLKCSLKRAPGPEEEASARMLFGLLRIVARAWSHLREAFESEGILDYTGLEEMTLQFLTNRADALRGKYRFLIVDEAQDLNRMQYQILRLLPVERSLFVGDPQQSIYLFRGADARLFEQQMQRSKVFLLSWNHRSTGRILRCVAECLEPSWREKMPVLRCATAPANPTEEEEEDVFATPSWTDHGPAVELWSLTKGEEIRQIADGIEEMIRVGGVEPSDITLITGWRSQIDQHASELGRRGIRATTLGTGISYFLRSEIRDLGAALRALSDPTDDFALLTVLRSPLVGMTFDGWTQVGLDAADVGGVLAWIRQRSDQLSDVDREAVERFLSWYDRLQPLAHQISTVELLSWIAHYTHLDARFALRRDAHRLVGNFRKLLRFAIEHGELTPAQFADWVRKNTIVGAKESDAETVGEDPRAEAAVKICNTHQAKGLEWNVVILDGRLHEPPSDEEILLDLDVPLAALSLASQHNLYASLIRERASDRAQQEYQRMLYVALTRAKQRLCIALNPNARGNYWRNFLNRLASVEEPWLLKRELGGEQLQEGQTMKAQSERE
jgi:ATP-dependent exoDNAse (exonuclease V) beta subunit